jgi:hypothetical protein
MCCNIQCQQGVADCFNVAMAVAAEVLLQLLLLRGGPAGLTWPLQCLLERRSALQCLLEQRLALMIQMLQPGAGATMLLLQRVAMSNANRVLQTVSTLQWLLQRKSCCNCYFCEAALRG